MNCLENYMGIRGECTTAKLYIDDLPGINIANIAKITNAVELRPIDLVNKCFNQAQKEVLQDIFSQFKMAYNQIIDDASYNYAGAFEYYGEVNEDWTIKINKLEYDKFIMLHVFGFELVVDRDVTVIFDVTDSYGATTAISQDLTKGINSINIDETTKSDFLEIKFNLSNFKIGVKELTSLSCPLGICTPCNRINSCGCRCLNVELYKDGELTYADLGFNLIARCEADECELLKYITPSIDIPLLYKTGIHYLLEAKLSGRINSYLRNTEDDIEQMLTLWMGGYDNQNDVKVYSLYWKKVKQTSDKIESMIYKLHSNIFTHGGSKICNTLPG